MLGVAWLPPEWKVVVVGSPFWLLVLVRVMTGPPPLELELEELTKGKPEPKGLVLMWNTAGLRLGDPDNQSKTQCTFTKNKLYKNAIYQSHLLVWCCYRYRRHF